MNWFRRTLGLASIALLLSTSVPARATVESCSVIGARIHAQSESDVILCGDTLPESIELRGLDPGGLDRGGIEQRYLMPLGQCNWNDKRRGFHVVLKATAEARTVPVSVVDKATGQAACDFTVEVLPPRPPEDRSWENSMPPESARFVDVNGIRTRYFDKGTGPTLLLVHGGQSGGYNNHARKWEAVFPQLTKTFRVIALDRLGQGETDNLPAEDYPNYYALDPKHLEGFIDALGLRDITLVGHSQGGWPVMRVALDRPDLVRCLVNVGTVLVPDDGKLMNNAMDFVRYVDGPVHPATGPTYYSARRGIALRLTSGNNIADSAVEKVLEQYQMRKIQDVRKVRNTMRLNPAHPSFIALKEQAYADIAAGKLTTRTLSIWGDRDLESPAGLGFPFHQKLIEGGVADATLVFVPGSGHSPHTEFPAAFASIVAEHCGPAVIRTTVQYALKDERSLKLDVTTPAGSEKPEQAAPAVVLLQGGGVPREEYGWLADALAAAGYVVVMPEHPGNLAISAIDHAGHARDFLVTASAGNALTRRVNPARVAVMGHSLGGVVATKAARTGGFAALVLLASYPEPADRESLSALKLSSLSVAGELDCVTSLAEVRDGATFLPSPASVVVLPGVTHFQFTNHDDKDRRPGCEPGVDLATAHASIAAAVKEFLATALKVDRVATTSR